MEMGTTPPMGSECLRYSPLPAIFDCVNTLKGGV